nr:MAG: major capsid protein [Microviridae sp.]
MSITRSIGKNTLGGGKKMQVDMRTYNRSTHDLSYVWRNTQSPGTLVPFLCELALPGDVHEIQLSASVLTHPTVGPLFGSFKLQLDVFDCPIRLYNAQLHNNKLGIGLDMSKVIFPVLEVAYDKEYDNPLQTKGQINGAQVNPSCLRSYLGFNGAGRIYPTANIKNHQSQCMPELMYYDIFKNYYANTQEENAYYITPDTGIEAVNIDGQAYNPNNINISFDGLEDKIIEISKGSGIETPYDIIFNVIDALGRKVQANPYVIGDIDSDTASLLTISVTNKNLFKTLISIESSQGIGNGQLSTFPLENIDIIREKILQAPTTSAFNVGTTVEPMTTLKGRQSNNYLNTTYPQCGLCVKTYQSDLFNNWINTEWIDGENGISEITAVSVSGGSFTIDALNLAQKVYNMMNRIAVSGGSYRDWIETVYTSNYIERAETPVYMGGMSDEIVFQEVISQAATEQEPLGSLAGRGKLANSKKGGYLKIKVEEPSYIIGIVSITPRIDYSQGNKWDRNLKTMNDLHKPALDAIGYQDLITSKMAWWDEMYTANPTSGWKKFSAGKQPAWIDYMSNYNRTHGNFAAGKSEEFMVLNRSYEIDPNKLTMPQSVIKDLTTYIDPVKYNYIFADTSLDAMNFWLQIGVKWEARRMMSAKVIPNL